MSGPVIVIHDHYNMNYYPKGEYVYVVNNNIFVCTRCCAT